MLIGNSLPEYIFIRLVILGLRAIAPLSIAYTILIILTQLSTISSPGLPLALEVYLFSEAAFFVVISGTLRIWLQNAAAHPKALGRAERRVLLQRILDSISNIDHYLAGWFLGVPAEKIHRDSVKEFLAWSLLNKHLDKLNPDENVELDDDVDRLEERLGQKLKTSKGATRSLRTTFDQVPMQHRPLMWYLIVCVVDLITHTRLLFYCRFYRSSLASTIFMFPPRPLALLGRTQKSTSKLSYWYRAHTSAKRHPVVFIHGIGVGLYPYVDFLFQLMSAEDDDDDGDVGIVILEILPISSRICAPALTTPEMKAQIQQILHNHGWTNFVLMAHSYGTAIASTILRDPVFSSRVKAVMLLDPICFLLHLPDVAFNFTRREPRRANERMLHYFSSQDMLISHTLARRFFWSEYVLWKEDLDADRPLTVGLSAQDLIVPKTEIWTYLTETPLCDVVPPEIQPLEGMVEWKNGHRHVLWFEDFDHAGLFNSKGARRGVSSIARRLCLVDGARRA